jgi:hypothetical protein
MDNLQSLIQQLLENIESLKGSTNVLLKKWAFDLNAAGSQTIDIAGNFFYVVEATDGVANIDIQFSRKDADIDKYNVVKGLGFVYPFDKVHISWAAQTSKTLTVLIGNLAPGLLNIIDNRSNIISDTLLQSILDEITGSVTAGNYGTVQITSAAVVQIRPALATRKSLVIQNLTGNTGTLYLGFTNAVSATNCFIALAPGQAWTIDDYRGDVYGLQTVNNDRATYGEVI